MTIGLSPAVGDVATVRSLTGDKVGTPLNPAVPGFATYEYWSDAEITSFILLGRGSLHRAAGIALTELATSLGAAGASVGQNDQRADTTKRASDVLAAAKVQFDLADGIDAQTAENDFYASVITPGAPFLFDTTPSGPPTNLGLRPDPLNPGYWTS